jgi:hypothetical protein
MTENTPETTLQHNPVTQALYDQIVAGVQTITDANAAFFEDESGTPIRDIDKALKDDDIPKPGDIAKAFARYQKAQAAAKASLTEARNLYRTEVLGEDEKVDNSIDEDEKAALKETRNVVVQAVSFLQTFSSTNGLTDVADWAKSLEIPQVGRKGSSTVGGSGIKRPRVYVSVDGAIHNSFTDAALAMTSKDSKVTAADLAEAWAQAGGGDGQEFVYGSWDMKVTNKPKPSDGK